MAGAILRRDGSMVRGAAAERATEPAQGPDVLREVTAIDNASLTATRRGSKDSKTFILTPETRFEGKPRVSSRVTIRYIASDEGDRAVRVIVRPQPRSSGNPPRFYFGPR